MWLRMQSARDASEAPTPMLPPSPLCTPSLHPDAAGMATSQSPRSGTRGQEVHPNMSECRGSWHRSALRPRTAHICPKGPHSFKITELGEKSKILSELVLFTYLSLLTDLCHHLRRAHTRATSASRDRELGGEGAPQEKAGQTLRSPRPPKAAQVTNGVPRRERGYRSQVGTLGSLGRPGPGHSTHEGPTCHGGAPDSSQLRTKGPKEGTWSRRSTWDSG